MHWLCAVDCLPPVNPVCLSLLEAFDSVTTSGIQTMASMPRTLKVESLPHSCLSWSCNKDKLSRKHLLITRNNKRREYMAYHYELVGGGGGWLVTLCMWRVHRGCNHEALTTCHLLLPVKAVMTIHQANHAHQCYIYASALSRTHDFRRELLQFSYKDTQSKGLHTTLMCICGVENEAQIHCLTQ